TDDGPWNHAVTSPRRECRKIYRVKTADPIPEDAAKRFARGMLLDGERQRTRPARLDVLGSHGALLAIVEGKYHQVKRLFGALGNRVVALHREAIGDVALDAALAEGHYRPLRAGEAACLAARGTPPSRPFTPQSRGATMPAAKRPALPGRGKVRHWSPRDTDPTNRPTGAGNPVPLPLAPAADRRLVPAGQRLRG